MPIGLLDCLVSEYLEVAAILLLETVINREFQSSRTGHLVIYRSLNGIHGCICHSFAITGMDLLIQELQVYLARIISRISSVCRD